MAEKYKITDHAVIRYLERVHDIDIGSIKRQISQHLDTKLPAVPRGKCTVKMGCGLMLHLVDGVLITITNKKSSKSKTRVSVI